MELGELTVTQTPAQGEAVKVRVCEPKAPVESQARTRMVCVPTLRVKGALIELVSVPGVFQTAVPLS